MFFKINHKEALLFGKFRKKPGETFICQKNYILIFFFIPGKYTPEQLNSWEL